MQVQTKNLKRKRPTVSHWPEVPTLVQPNDEPPTPLPAYFDAFKDPIPNGAHVDATLFIEHAQGNLNRELNTKWLSTFKSTQFDICRKCLSKNHTEFVKNTWCLRMRGFVVYCEHNDILAANKDEMLE